MKYFFLFFFTCFCMASNAQDKIFLRIDSVVTGKIVYADSVKVKIRMAERPEGPDYVFRKIEIIKVVFESGKTIFYKHKYFENSIGVGGSYYYNYFAGHGYYFTNLDIDGKYGAINFQVRESVAGLKVEAGYGQLKRVTEILIHNGYRWNTSTDTTIDSTHSYRVYFNISGRLNATYDRRINPFVSGSLLVQDIAVMYMYGFGIQCRINKKYFIEAEISLTKWNGNDDLGNEDYSNEMTYFSFGISRILESKYINGK